MSEENYLASVKACPFCGGEIVKIQCRGGFFIFRYVCSCIKCGALGPASSIHGTQENAVTLWNRRIGGDKK